MRGAAGALVPAAPVPDWATWNSGGPISHGAGNVKVDVEHHYVMPGGGQANDIEGDPSPYWTGGSYGFGPNGEFMLGASEPVMPPMHLTANVVSSIGPTVTMALGAGAGAVFAPNHRVLGTVLGALAGGILGVIFAPG